jgi:hypothetical protein
MKLKLFPILCALALAGCASPAPSSAPQSKPKTAIGDMSNPEADNPPFIGMTKAQALARYGEPKKRTLTDEGETWVYVLNMGEVIGRAMIPFNFKPTQIRTSVLIFGPNGRVKKFNWDTPTEG